MNKKYRMIAMLSLFVIILTCLRIVWIDRQQPIEHPQAVNGILDLRGWELPEDRTITLNGEWAFYPSAYVLPKLSGDMSHTADVTTSFTPHELTTARQTIQVPSTWDKAFDEQLSYHFGTYHLTILLDSDSTIDHYGLRIRTIRYASSIYVNGQLVSSEGMIAEQERDFIPHVLPQSVTVDPVDDRIELTIQVASHTSQAGVIYPIRFGAEQAVEQRIIFSMAVQLLTATMLLIHALYALILTWMSKGNRLLVHFFFMMGCAVVTVLISDDKLLYTLFQVDYETEIKIFLLSYAGFSITLPLFLNQLFSGYSNRTVLRWFSWFVFAYIAFIIIAPTKILYPPASILLTATMLGAVFMSILIMFRAWRQREDVFFVLLGCAALSLNIIWAIVFSRTYYDQIHYPVDLIIAVGCFTAFWFKRFFQANHEALQLAEKLHEQNIQKDEFLANTSHELRNPLHGMINITQTILDDPDHPPHRQHREKMEMMVAVGRRMSLMLDDLLDATRLKDRMIQLKPAYISLQSVANGVIEMLDFMVDTRHIQFRLDIPDALPRVWADKNRLIQILYNLMHNAVKYTEQGEIVIRARMKGKMATIDVEDTGIGMDEQTIERIFLPYEQGDASKQRASGGFGLGLSICRQLVELHGSNLTVRSSPGKGSCFTFTLPISQASQQITEAIVPSEPPSEQEAAVAAAMSKASESESGIIGDLASDMRTEAPTGMRTSANTESEMDTLTSNFTESSVDTLGGAEQDLAEDMIGRPTELNTETLANLPSHRNKDTMNRSVADRNKGTVQRSLTDQESDTTKNKIADLAQNRRDGSDTNGERRKVLIIEDDLVNLRLLAEILGNTLYGIRTASNGAEALALLEEHRFDLIISDVMMPHITGYELTRIVRERFSQYELPVLLLTARSRAEDIFAGFQSGANDYVTKPVDATELRARVYALTELKHSIDQRLRFEGAWLQAQIRPHFLYNTLNSIAALSTIDLSKMRDLLEHFGHYLRTSFDFHNLDHVVKLDRELDLVRSYLYIEKQRFGERLEVRWEISANLHRVHVPPLSIQTLVENALNHGILKRATGGFVEIRIIAQQDYTEIIVNDNGVGMSEEQIQSVKAGVLQGRDGIGLYNTDRRLRQLFDSGLTFESRLGEGTTVSFRIPTTK